MAGTSTFPNPLDTFTTSITATENLSQSGDEHDLVHNQVHDALNRIEALIGAWPNPAGGSLNAILRSTSTAGHNHDGSNSRLLSAAQPVSLKVNNTSGTIGPETVINFNDTSTVTWTIADVAGSRMNVSATANVTSAAGNPRSATVYIAASNATADEKANADYIVGNGTNTAYSSFVAALADLGAGGGTIMLSSGNFALTQKVLLPSYVRVTGQGASTIITITAGTWSADDAAFMLAAVSSEGVEIDHLYITGSIGTAVSGISFTNTGSGARYGPEFWHRLHDLTIRTTARDGILLNGARGSQLSNIHIGSTGASVARYGINATSCPNAKYSDIHITSTGDIGFYHSGGNAQGHGLRVNLAGAAGFQLDGTRGHWEVEAQDCVNNGVNITNTDNMVWADSDSNGSAGAGYSNVYCNSGSNMITARTGNRGGAGTASYGVRISLASLTHIAVWKATSGTVEGTQIALNTTSQAQGSNATGQFWIF